MTTEGKKYDVILFGVTGFTGKLTVEYLLKSNYDISWAACARNAAKAESVLKDISDSCSRPVPPLLTADLICDSPEKEEALRKVVCQTKIVLTCAGPFEKYGTTLVKLCAQEGVSYADITGETDFFRSMIDQYDKVARDSGAVILCHCGNDCIPQDLTVYEMNQYAIKHEAELEYAMTYVEMPESASWSGGTAATAAYQLGKHRKGAKPSFDPLLQSKDGSKSGFSTKNISPRGNEYDDNLQCTVGPWIMAPVMVNCVRRSNALLGYSKEFQYGDAQIKNWSWMGSLKLMGSGLALAAAIYVPGMNRLLPQPGEGPDRETMEAGYLTVYGRGVMVKGDHKETHLQTKFHFSKDVGYLYTAALLVETGMVLLDKRGKVDGGVMTPAVALGSDLTKRILLKMDTSFAMKEE